MRKPLGLFFVGLFALAGCAQQEMVKIEKCVEIVGVKYYQTTFLGMPITSDSWYILADGSRVIKDSENRMMAWDNYGKICTTKFVPAASKK